jgi:hypothetical protein
MEITSKVDICNLALGSLGNYGSVTNIDTPSGSKEATFALWYDITRQTLLKRMIPNFSLARRTIAATSATPPFGYENVFEYPSDCLKVLGLGNIDERAEYIYCVEGGYIYTADVWANGLKLRFVRDIKDVNRFSPEFKLVFAAELAKNVALDITQSPEKAALIEKVLPMRLMELSSINAQENRPIRVSVSRFKQARHWPPGGAQKQ